MRLTRRGRIVAGILWTIVAIVIITIPPGWWLR